jgi:HSP20 family molecular chaperone IbpA
MFGKNNYFFSILAEDLKKRSKENYNEIKTQFKDFDLNDFFKKDIGLKKTATIDGTYSYQIDAPGFTKESLNINLSEGILSIEGKAGERIISYDIFVGDDVIKKVTLELGILDIKITEVTPKEKNTKINID